MSSSSLTSWQPSDSVERDTAIDTSRSVLVEAPAGSGKTSLLTQRFLALLSRVDDPRQIVAITFTNAAAAEMRHRVLDALARAADGHPNSDALALAALARSEAKEWKLLEQPNLLRIATIDSFCREIALQQPLLAGLGGSLSIAEQTSELSLKAARRTLQKIDDGPEDLREAIATLLRWRDNSWSELESQLVKMLATRDRWMQGFVFADIDDDTLREGLQRPFARAVIKGLTHVDDLLGNQLSNRIQELAQFAASNPADKLNVSTLATCDVLTGPALYADAEALESAFTAYREMAGWLLKADGDFRQSWTKSEGFPPTAKSEKAEISLLVKSLDQMEGLKDALLAVRELPSLAYGEDEWQIVRACFVLLRYAAAELKTVFSEVGKCDFTEVSQIAQQALTNSEGAFTLANDIRHLLVDEFQDTSRRQHRLLADLIALWEDREDRTLFVVGDPRQSIYFFRDADAELFPRVKDVGLEIGDGDYLLLDRAQLTANFRTQPALVSSLNEMFSLIFSRDDGSGITHTDAEAARTDSGTGPACNLHLSFVPAPAPFKRTTPEQAAAAVKAADTQVDEIVGVIRGLQPRIDEAMAHGQKFRIAVLARTHKSLLPIAAALRVAGIPFRAIDLEYLGDRLEVTDVLALAHAVLNPEDRVAWLGALRAPWCGLALADLHALTSNDDPALLSARVPDLASERIGLLGPDAQVAVRRLLDVAAEATYLRASQPDQALGAWLETVWQRVGGAACVEEQGRANLDLLWSALDQLQGGEQDLVGPALTSALKELKAQPDPAASSVHGVQLLTIHKSKGLEFETVIVPELQAQAGGTKLNMLSWLERGLSGSDDRKVPTEFLVAPFSTKGSNGGAIKKWVDREYLARERQEMRRLLYVAATRAREELHLFARPTYRESEDGPRTLSMPADSLLSAAWPALESKVRAQFAAMTPEPVSAPRPQSVVTSTILHRLPADVTIPRAVEGLAMAAAADSNPNEVYTRESGGIESRVLGRAVHTLLELTAKWRDAGRPWDECESSIALQAPRLAAQMRAAGVRKEDAARFAGEAADVALAAVKDTVGRWVLDQHPEAAAEASWTGIIAGQIRSVQADRVFRAGAPLHDGNDLWVVDYKSGVTAETDDPAAIMRLRSLFSPQLEVYAQVLKHLYDDDSLTVRAGIYYPRMGVFDSWIASSSF